jgi:hypothetical protein
LKLSTWLSVAQVLLRGINWLCYARRILASRLHLIRERRIGKSHIYIIITVFLSITIADRKLAVSRLTMWIAKQGKSLYYLCLVVIFLYAVGTSFVRLLEKKIGTMQHTKIAKLALYPSVTLCPKDYNPNSDGNITENFAGTSAIDCGLCHLITHTELVTSKC